MYQNKSTKSTLPMQTCSKRSLSSEASRTILKRCEELFDHHQLCIYSKFSQEPLLSSKDAKVLRHIIESNERYHCLKEEDSDFLKQVFAEHMSTVKSHRKFLKGILKKFKDKRQNEILAKESTSKCSIRDNSLSVSTDLEFDKFQTDFGDTQVSKSKNYSEKAIPSNDNQLINVLYHEEYDNYIGFMQTVQGYDKIVVIPNSYQISDRRSNYSKIADKSDKIERNPVKYPVKTNLNDKSPTEKYICPKVKINLATFDNGPQKFKNWMVFFINLVLCSMLVLSFIVVDLHCVDDILNH